jgi:hypothetical protein
MKANDNIRTNLPEDVIELGVASIETKGSSGFTEGAGTGLPVTPGISEE